MVNVPYPRYTTEADAVIDIANSLRRISEIIGWNTATTGVIDSQPTAFREVAFRIAEYLAALEEGVAEPPAAVGPPGETNEITIGVVDTLAPGSPATASLTGVSPAQVLNLGIPAGANGIDGINGEDGEDGAGGGGDMFKATYDPTNVNGNAFDMEKMVEGATKKILTPAERTKIGTIPGTGFATVAETGMATDVQTENLSGYWIGGTVEHALENIGDVLYGGTAGPPVFALKDSPVFTGTPTAPTPPTADSDQSVATTAYVQANLANVIAKGMVDAKGDLIVATANDTPARLAVGANGFVLTADSAEATGMKWAAAAGGGGGGALRSMVPKSGQYLYPNTSAQWGIGAATYTTGADFFVPLVLAGEISCDTLACRITTAEAGVNVRILLYASDADGHPTTLVATGTASTAGAGQVDVTFSPVTLPAGLYWGALRTDAGSAVRFWALQSHQIIGGGIGPDALDAKTPLPSAQVGTYASPNTTLGTITYSGTSGTSSTVPFVAIGRV
jgi:hypothetical protein